MKKVSFFIEKCPNHNHSIYPVVSKYLITKNKFPLKLLLLLLLSSFMFIATSCKTCKCPAYSSIQTQTIATIHG